MTFSYDIMIKNRKIKKMIEVLLGQVPEALYFALFIIFAKQLKLKRIWFTVLMALEYILLLNVLPYSIWSHILYFIITYTILKMLYHEECQITDLFTLTIASIILIMISIVASLLFSFSITLAIIMSRIIMFGLILILNNKLNKIQKLYKNLWNRNDKIKKKVKSTTFRAINIIVFNFMFHVINFRYDLCIVF